jgi:hypothetical protein
MAFAGRQPSYRRFGPLIGQELGAVGARQIDGSTTFVVGRKGREAAGTVGARER